MSGYHGWTISPSSWSSRLRLRRSAARDLTRSCEAPSVRTMFHLLSTSSIFRNDSSRRSTTTPHFVTSSAILRDLALYRPPAEGRSVSRRRAMSGPSLAASDWYLAVTLRVQSLTVLVVRVTSDSNRYVQSATMHARRLV